MNVRHRTTRALVTWAVGAAIMRLTLWAPEVCPPITEPQAHAAARQAGDWLVRTQDYDGTSLYGWNRATE